MQRRPASSPPNSSSAPSEAAVRPSAGLTLSEARRAEELEAQIRADEQAAEAARRQARERAKDRTEVVRSAGTLAAVADHEYDYVARDLRRIGLTAGLIVAILAVIWFLVEVARVINIG
jgi:hypothetical protein